VYARAGRRDEALKILEHMKALAASGNSVPESFNVGMARLYASLGDKDQALAWLERVYQEHHFAVTNLRVHPWWDPLRSDPRFTQLLKKVGLEP
jgi:serine/threonine-protein kinase